MRLSQLLSEYGITLGALPRKVEQGVEPEVGEIEYLVTLFHEPNWQKTPGEFVVGVYLRRNPS